MPHRDGMTRIFAASVALLNADTVLLIQRARPPYEGFWTLPGGRMEPGETPEACARREIGEELGIVPGPLTQLFSMAVGPGIAGELMVFASRSFDGELVPCDEIAGLQWTRRDELSALRTTPGLARVIDAAFKALGAASPPR